MIFGIQEPKIIYNNTDYLLDYCTGTYTFNKSTVITNTDIINGKSYNNIVGAYMDYDLTINLFKYSDIQAKYLEIIGLINKEFTFMPHRDGNTIYNVNNEIAKFRITDAKLKKINEKYDTLNIKITSLSYIKGK